MILDKIFKNSNNELISIMDILNRDNEFANYIYTLAEAHAIDLIARTISKCEIQTFEEEDGTIKKTKGNLYWTLNLQPNYNENGTQFFYKLARKLLTDKKALVIINKKNKVNLLYVAESYNASNEIMYGKIFNNIELTDDEGNSFMVKKTYDQNDSIYFTLKYDNLATASERFKENTSKILKASQKSFINANTRKWRLKNPGTQPTMLDIETKKPISYEEYKQKITDGLLSDEDAIILLSQMFDLIDLNNDKKGQLDDFEKTVKQIGDIVAQKWNIPLTIFYGNKTEKSTATEDYITFAVDPYFEIIEDGLNVALVGKKSYLNGEFIKINRNKITHKDILDSANGIDKLRASGFSRNETNELLGLPEIKEDWADKHYITKNYGNVEGGAEEDE